MNREILFRGKTVPTQDCESEWIVGDLLSNAYPIPNIRPLGNICCYQVIPSTVGQYAGLTDRNGVKIFEGDILQLNNNPKDIRQVIFGLFMVIDFETESEVDEVIGWYCKVIPTDALSRTRPFCLPMSLTDYYIHQCNMKIIGNIHDNPELLKGEENV